MQPQAFPPSSVQIKRKPEHRGTQTAAADLYTFFPASYSSTGASEHAAKQQRAAPRLFFVGNVNPVPLLVVVSIFYAILAFLLFRPSAGSYSIKTLSFGEEPAFSRALHSYIFPEQEDFTGQEIYPVDSSAISTVTFRNYTVKKGETISGIAARAGLRNFGSTDGLLYTVKKNETLAGIAAAYQVSVTALLDANDLTGEILSVGQQLFIPGVSLSSFDLKKALGELFLYPIQGRLTSPFGYRSDPFTGAKSYHTGVDLAAPTGTPVKATLDGKVAETGYNRIFGNYVIITHDRGYQSLYGHLSAIYAKRGQYITQGSSIGAVGNTGYSTGPHLHLSIYKNGSLIDPLSVLK